jgi:hypothetical protein
MEAKALARTPMEYIAKLEADLAAAQAHAATLGAQVEKLSQIVCGFASIQYDPKRCFICGWPLATSQEEGCVPGNCSYRPARGAEWTRLKFRGELEKSAARHVASVRNAALEEAAAECERVDEMAYGEIAVAIRALKRQVPS